jgi:DNA-binding YbaB/EbfC family protein
MANKFGGFGGFGGGNMQAMMRQAQKMQQDALKAKEELDNTIFEGTASGEMVKIEINGAYEMQSVKINPAVVDPDDVEMLEDLVVAAYNDAKNKADEAKSQKMGAFGGLV